MEKQSLIFTWKASFYMDNITSTLTIVVFSINCSRTSDVLQTRTENFEQPKNNSIASESPDTSRVFRSMHLHYTAILMCVFSVKFCMKSEEYFPRSFDIVVISDVPTRYLIFCTKQTREQSLFDQQHPERHVTFPECLHFPGHMARLCSETPKGVL